MEIVAHEQYTYKFDSSACAECGGHCCTGESGYIWAKYTEIEKMATFVNLSIEDFATMYLRKVKHRYSLIEKQLSTDNFACIFLMRVKSDAVFIQCVHCSVALFLFGNSLNMMKKR